MSPKSWEWPTNFGLKFKSDSQRLTPMKHLCVYEERVDVCQVNGILQIHCTKFQFQALHHQHRSSFAGTIVRQPNRWNSRGDRGDVHDMSSWYSQVGWWRCDCTSVALRGDVVHTDSTSRQHGRQKSLYCLWSYESVCICQKSRMQSETKAKKIWKQN